MITGDRLQAITKAQLNCQPNDHQADWREVTEENIQFELLHSSPIFIPPDFFIVLVIL